MCDLSKTFQQAQHFTPHQQCMRARAPAAPSQPGCCLSSDHTSPVDVGCLPSQDVSVSPRETNGSVPFRAAHVLCASFRLKDLLRSFADFFN